MRKYITKQNIKQYENLTTGEIGEKVFYDWFKNNFYSEQIFKQLADRDYQQIDFADEKGYTYQVKTTKGRSYTFNCDLEDVKDHLNADVYVFIQIKENIAYMEPFYNKDYIFKNITDN